MARNYSQIMCAIWDEADFLALSEAAQRAYFLLVTQKDISAAGVLHMWTPRWAAMSRTSSEESLKAALHELKVARYIVPDWVTGELLVRTFVKWDGGYQNSKRKPLIIREALGVRSMEIKVMLRSEFEKLGLDPSGLPEPPPPTGTDTPSDRASDAVSDGGRGSNGTPIGPASTSMANGYRATSHALGAQDQTSVVFPQVDRASDRASDATSPSEGVVGTTEVTTGDPQPQTPQPQTPQPVPPTAGPAALELVINADIVTAGDVVAAWAEGFSATGNQPVRQQRGQVGKEARELLDAGNDPQRVLTAARVLGTKGRATLVAELAIQSQQQPRSVYRPAAMDWQLLKQTGTNGPELRALPGGSPS